VEGEGAALLGRRGADGTAAGLGQDDVRRRGGTGAEAPGDGG